MDKKNTDPTRVKPREATKNVPQTSDPSTTISPNILDDDGWVEINDMNIGENKNAKTYGYQIDGVGVLVWVSVSELNLPEPGIPSFKHKTNSEAVTTVLGVKIAEIRGPKNVVLGRKLVSLHAIKPKKVV
jgi:hypothetical protein